MAPVFHLGGRFRLLYEPMWKQFYNWFYNFVVTKYAVINTIVILRQLKAILKDRSQSEALYCN